MLSGNHEKMPNSKSAETCEHSVAQLAQGPGTGIKPMGWSEELLFAEGEDGHRHKAKGGAREQRLVEAFDQPATKLIVYFLHAVLPNFDQFNLLLQTEAPMVHRLYPAMILLYKTILSCVVQPSVIQGTENILTIDLDCTDVLKTDPDLHIGFAATQHIMKEDLQGTTAVSSFKAEVRDFYLGVLQYMKKKFPFKNLVFKNAPVIDPAKRASVTSSMLITLMNQFSSSEIDREKVFGEFCLYQGSSDEELDFSDGDSFRIDEFWAKLAAKKHVGTGQQLFANLAAFAKIVLLVPHSMHSVRGFLAW
ncbi:hypothetical protein CAPTEDRAFT_184958 [Capitella teleta]|uniref:HAT C-terminal dimerisation domain-containing protein n=1 Tax=Capitella teleta TaxID=283909 RepID=R7UEJ4_CAPTE|nr:hypothetical protein CAPTEDRAFT_184958 [Capitella teleta]|eukprot:ELU04954.1 hypothetical protein CAPTEDRAFT_184958 [Capitella teleta]